MKIRRTSVPKVKKKTVLVLIVSIVTWVGICVSQPRTPLKKLPPISDAAVMGEVKKLYDSNPAARYLALKNLEDMGGRAKAAVPAIIELLNDFHLVEKIEDEHGEITFVGQMGSGDPYSMITWGTGPLYNVAGAAATCLGQIGDSTVVAPLIKALQGEEERLFPYRNRYAQAHAAYALGEIGGERACRALREAIYDTTTYMVVTTYYTPVLRAAITSLGKLQDVSAVPILCGTLNHEDEYVRVTTAEALGRIRDKAAAECLVDALTSTSDNLVVACIKSLTDIGDTSCTMELVPMLQSNNTLIQLRTVKALERINDERAVEYLIPLLGNSDADVRSATLEALQNISGLQLPEAECFDPGAWEKAWRKELRHRNRKWWEFWK